MALSLPHARRPVVGVFPVPASKSILQRVLALRLLGGDALDLPSESGPGPGRDVLDLQRALGLLGPWQGAALGRSRASLALDLGLGATGFRLATALATLRPSGARTLVRGRPALLARPHQELRRALGRLGGHVVRKASGAHRVLGGGMRGGRLSLGCRTSSQHLSALMLLAPRLGGLELTLVDRPVSSPYLRVTAQVLAQFGIACRIEGLEAPGGRIQVAAGAPLCARVVIEPDASAATAWWAAAALTGGEACVPGLTRGSLQADMALLGVLERMGAQLSVTADGSVQVRGPADGLVAAGEVHLSDAPDLLPIVAALAATARGTTRILGAAHVRGKESDRIASSAAALCALGGRAEVLPDGLEVRGGPLHGGVVAAAGDHRIVFAAALLGLVVSGVEIQGAQAAAKSHPTFLDELSRAAGA